VEAEKRHDEGGFTLVELMVSIAILALALMPILAWMSLGFRTEQDIQRRSHDARVTNLLAQYLPLDVQSAAEVSTQGDPCPLADGSTVPPVPGPSPAEALPPGTVETVVLALVHPDVGSGAVRTIYGVEEASDGTGALWRTRCDVATGSLSSRVLLANHLIRPASGWRSLVSCEPTGALPQSCRQVTVVVRTRSNAPISVTALQRHSTSPQ
jgi:prepilin-type N-terminal cleavage/methylation domain-containing protein